MASLSRFASVSTYEKIFKIPFNFRWITETANRLNPFLRSLFGHVHGQHYTSEEFESIMEEQLSTFNHFETYFILTLFRLSQLNPLDFAKKINYRSGRVNSLIDIFKNRQNLVTPNSLSYFDSFIRNNIPFKYHSELLNMLESIRDIRRQEFVHYKIRYDFGFNEKLVKDIWNDQIRSFFSQYFETIMMRQLPDAFFTLKPNSRVSNLCISGIQSEPLKSISIFDKFIIPLYEQGLISIYRNDYFLSTFCRFVIESYSEGFRSKPTHQPILSAILQQSKISLAIEVPIWFNFGCEFTMTGHIDLIMLRNDEIIVADYKLNRFQMLRSIPQICIYGYLLNKMLTNLGLNLSIKCLLFSPREAWEFSFRILETHFLNFINKTNNLRTHPIIDKLGRNIYDFLKFILPEIM
jgi:hypothetical protein